MERTFGSIVKFFDGEDGDYLLESNNGHVLRAHSVVLEDISSLKRNKGIKLKENLFSFELDFDSHTIHRVLEGVYHLVNKEPICSGVYGFFISHSSCPTHNEEIMKMLKFIDYLDLSIDWQNILVGCPNINLFRRFKKNWITFIKSVHDFKCFDKIAELFLTEYEKNPSILEELNDEDFSIEIDTALKERIVVASWNKTKHYMAICRSNDKQIAELQKKVVNGFTSTVKRRIGTDLIEIDCPEDVKMIVSSLKSSDKKQRLSE